MRLGHQANIVLLSSACTGLFALVGAACLPENAQEPTLESSAAGQTVDAADGTPDELAAMISEASARSAKQTKLLAGGANLRLRTKELRRQLLTGIKAADKLLAHEDAGEPQRCQARLAKLELLRRGTQHDPATFRGRLKDYVEQLDREAPKSTEAAVADAIWLELSHLTGRSPKEEVLPLLVEFAEKHPGNKAGIELFRRYGQLLESKKDRNGAIQVYHAAVALYNPRPDTAVLSGRLRELERARARQLAAQRVADAKRAEIIRRLGGKEDGYFLIYAEENVKPPRHGIIVYYHYDYEVAHGLTAAVNYVNGLPETWSWELVRRFPKTPSGRAKAYDLWKKRLRKK